MSNSRQAILDALATGGPTARARERTAPPVPRRPAGDPALVAAWAERAAAAGASLARVAGPAAAGAEVAAYLERCSLAPAVVAAPALRSGTLEWPAGLQVEYRAAGAHDPVAVTGAFAAVAETGSVVCLGGPDHPTSLNFLCEHHVVVLTEDRVLADLDDLWLALAGTGRALPRALNIITGPSRTADIEQRLQLGAHGPRRLHVIALAAG